MSKQESKDFQEAAEVCYILENLNMRGPGAMPVRGLVYRKVRFYIAVPSSARPVCLCCGEVVHRLLRSGNSRAHTDFSELGCRLNKFVCQLLICGLPASQRPVLVSRQKVYGVL